MDTLLSQNNEALKRQFLALKTTGELAGLLEIDYSRLIYNIYIKPKGDRYKTFEISKRNGHSRTIYAPNNSLKFIQRKLNEILRAVYEPKATVHGFVVNKSIKTNAAMHCRNRYVLNLDLRDFFPSITFRRVRGLFMAIPYELPEEVAILLANICCHDGALPQGAPTSPIISNMICSRLDTQLRRLAVRYRCVYTRYADDLTFSTRQKVFPADLAKITSIEEEKMVEIGQALQTAVESNGFQINQSKVRLQTYDKRQEVTGLIVNRFPNVNRKYVSQIRAMIHAWEKYGLENAEREFFERWDKKNRNPFAPQPSFKQIVKGKIEFLGMVRGKDNLKYLDFLAQLAKLDPDLVPNSEEEIKNERRFLKSLQDVLNKHFNRSELKNLCFDLDVKYENIERVGANFEETVIDFIQYMNRRNLLSELENAIRNKRPNITF